MQTHLFELGRLIDECWDPHPNARPTALLVKKRLGKILHNVLQEAADDERLLANQQSARDLSAPPTDPSGTLQRREPALVV